MIGNQTLINTQIVRHEKNPIKEPINGIDPFTIIDTITNEQWKQWRKKLTHSPNPYIRMDGVGSFSLMHGKAKHFLRKLAKKIRRFKEREEGRYLLEGTKANAIYKSYIMKFNETWKQVDELKKELVWRKERWRNIKIERYGDKAIL